MTQLPPPTSTQPQVNNLRIYSSKKCPTIRVTMKNSDDDDVLIINERDFDDGRHVRLD